MATEIREFIPPNSSSPTIIGKGIFHGIPAYFKIFYNGTNPAKRNESIDALSYETEIYKLSP